MLGCWGVRARSPARSSAAAGAGAVLFPFREALEGLDGVVCAGKCERFGAASRLPRTARFLLMLLLWRCFGLVEMCVRIDQAR